MVRPLRIKRASGRYHVTARGNKRRLIYRGDRDRQHFQVFLVELPERFGSRGHGWGPMDNHFHLPVETPQANLSQTGQWLHVSYACGSIAGTSGAGTCSVVYLGQHRGRLKLQELARISGGVGSTAVAQAINAQCQQ